MPTKAELESRIEKLGDRITYLEEALKVEEENGLAIEECREMLADLGHNRTFFTEGVESVCQEVKALRYDVGRYRELVASSAWLKACAESEEPMPRRPPEMDRELDSLLVPGDSFALAE